MDDKSLQYDLAERTARYGEQIIELAMAIPRTSITSPLISQIVRSGTSIGANYCEADEASSRKDFKYRISICCRECRETKYWLRMMAKATQQAIDEIRRLWKEADELMRIFSTIRKRSSIK